MDFSSDLAKPIATEFKNQGISFPQCADTDQLVSRYLEMRVRRIEPVPRGVHFSEDIHDSLGDLARRKDPKHSSKALEAWGAVFYLRHLFEIGGKLTPYLTERVNDTETSDGLLWDYSMHHMHLSRNPGKQGFVERSDWLLFAIVGDRDAFFVDVRPHTDPEQLLWVRQDLLAIVHGNWPELTASRELKRIKGDAVTDTEKLELRRKNVNLVHKVGDRAIGPLGWGTMSDGHSSLCRFLADKLLYELEQQQRILDEHAGELRAAFAARGLAEDAQMEFKLVRKADLNVSADQVTELCSVDGLSRDLWNIGFAIIEGNTRSLIAV